MKQHKGRNKAIKKSSFSKPSHSTLKTRANPKSKYPPRSQQRRNAPPGRRNEQPGQRRRQQKKPATTSGPKTVRGLFNEGKAGVSHSQQRHQSVAQRKQHEKIHKLLIEKQLASGHPDEAKIEEHLKQIKSRGLRQRLKGKLRTFEHNKQYVE